MAWVDTILQGLLLGGLYALFATGLSLIFGVMRIVNLAHGDLSILAAFLARRRRWRRSASNPFAGAGPGGAAAWPRSATALQMLLLNRAARPRHPAAHPGDVRVLDHHPERAARDLLGRLAPAESRRHRDRERVAGRAVSRSAGSRSSRSRWRCVILRRPAAASSAGCRLGRAFRATSDDQETAELMGIDNRRLYGLAMALVARHRRRWPACSSASGRRSRFSSGPDRLLFAFEA